MSQQTLPCTPSLPHFFRIGVNCGRQFHRQSNPKNVLKGKSVLFGVIRVKRLQNVDFEHIHSNQF